MVNYFFLGLRIFFNTSNLKYQNVSGTLGAWNTMSSGQYSDAYEQNVCSPETGRSDQGVATTNNLLNINAINSSAPKAKRRHQERWRKAGTMMAVCTLLHIVLWLPFWLDLFNLTSSVILRFTFLFSHATNPIVYGVVNDKMRQGLKKVLSCK